jgi:hypothetical protein
MASLAANPDINDALVALAPEARETVIAFARKLHERNLSTKPKADCYTPIQFGSPHWTHFELFWLCTR